MGNLQLEKHELDLTSGSLHLPNKQGQSSLWLSMDKIYLSARLHNDKDIVQALAINAT